MVKKKTHEEFQSELNKKFNNEFTCLSKYNGINNRVKVKHNKCGYEFEPLAKFLLRDGKCKRCSDMVKGKKSRRNHTEFLQDVKKVHGDDYVVLSKYKTVKDKVKVRHRTCGSEYFIRPDSLLRGSKCSFCNYKRYSKENRKTTEEYKKEVNHITQGEYTLISEYSSVKEKVKIRHNSCGHEYSVYPYMFYRGRRCPKCNYSRGEKTVENVLNYLGIEYEPQKEFEGLKNVNNLSYDFYLPKHNVVIEYQGQQHYRPVEFFGGLEPYLKQKENDEIKKEFAKDNKLYLLEIPYTKYTFDTIKEEIDNMLSDVKQGII